MIEQNSVWTRLIPYDGKSHKWPQVFAIFVVALSCVTAGALFSWPSPAIPILISNASHIEVISLEEASYFAVIPPVAAAIAAPFLAVLVDVIGRKKAVMFIAVPHLLSWTLIALANNLYIFYLSRFLNGIADATLFSALATYVGEIAVPSVRGSWGNLVAIGIYFGQFIVNVVGAYFDIRTTAYIFGCLPIIYLFLTALLPESPYFLVMKGREKEAREALQTLNWKEDVEDELISLTKDVNRQISESGTLKDLFTIPTNRKALWISVAIRGSQQLSGLPAFAVYTQYMFNQAGGDLSAATSAMIYSGALFLAITGFAFVVDKFGRKPMMTFSSFGCGIVLAIEATYFYLDQKGIVDTSGITWIPLGGMLTYIVVCSAGLGIIPTLMLGELFSASVKGKALCVLNISFSIYILSVSKLFQTLTSSFGMYVPFYFFAACCAVSTVFSYFFIPETKGKTLEEIQFILKGRSYVPAPLNKEFTTNLSENLSGRNSETSSISGSTTKL